MTGAPRAPSRPFAEYSRNLPSGRHAGSWWPSGGDLARRPGRVELLGRQVVELEHDVALGRVGASETSAIVLPSGDRTGWRIQENHDAAVCVDPAGQERSGLAAAVGVDAHERRDVSR